MYSSDANTKVPVSVSPLGTNSISMKMASSVPLAASVNKSKSGSFAIPFGRLVLVPSFELGPAISETLPELMMMPFSKSRNPGTLRPLVNVPTWPANPVNDCELIVRLPSAVSMTSFARVDASSVSVISRSACAAEANALITASARGLLPGKKRRRAKDDKNVVCRRLMVELARVTPRSDKQT